MTVNDEFSKHGWKFVAGFVAVVLISITTLFFYTGSVMSGMIMTGILVLLLVSARRKDRRDLQLRNATLDYSRQNSQDVERSRQLAADHPPSYRLTWRRSFIEKFKTLTNEDNPNSEEPNPSLEGIPTISGNSVPDPAINMVTSQQLEEASATTLDTVSYPGEYIPNSSGSYPDEGLPSFEEATEDRRSPLVELLARDHGLTYEQAIYKFNGPGRDKNSLSDTN